MRRNAQRVGKIEPVQRFPKDRDVAVRGVGQHSRARQTRGPSPPEECQREAPLFLKPHLRRHLNAFAPRAIARPLGRQIQRRAQQPRTALGPQKDRRGHLAIGDLAECAAVLARDPH